MTRVPPYPWNRRDRRDARLCERDHLYISRPVSAHSRASVRHISEYDARRFDPISRSGLDCTFLHFTIRRRTFRRSDSHVRDYVYHHTSKIQTYRGERRAVTIFRKRLWLNALCHVARPSRRVFVRVVLCVIDRFPARARSAFPADVAMWKSLSDERRRQSDKSETEKLTSLPAPPPCRSSFVFGTVCCRFIVWQIECIPQCNLDQIISKCLS